jgi:polyisoprenoid-binding protein YceI
MLKRIVVLGTVIVVVIGGVVAYALFKPPKEASAPIQAIPLDPQGGAQPTATAMALGQAGEPATPTTVSVEPTPVSTQEPETIVAATQPATQEPDAGGAASGVDASGDTPTPLVFSIVPEQSEVRFYIDEVLRGADNTVVGTTNQVAGELAVDPANPSQSRVGTILVNARTLTTDNDFRNRAIKNQILDTNSYEFITFVPAQLQGLPDSAAVGESYDFQITGDLTIRDVTHQVTFAVNVTPLSETELHGTASTTVTRGDYGLVIPDVPSVSSVSEEVTLEIDFVATAG